MIRVYKLSEYVWKRFFCGILIGRTYKYNTFLKTKNGVYMITKETSKIPPNILFIETSENRPILVRGLLVDNKIFYKKLEID